MIKKKAFFDVFINLIAASLCTVTLNFVVYPLYAKRFSSYEYGTILTLIGVVNLLWSVLGNCLNNTRLVLNRRDDIENEEGNYNILAILAAGTGAVIIFIVSFFFHVVAPILVILLALTVIVGILRAYYVVSFRLKLDYVTQLKTNSIVASGYIIGILVAKSLDVWPVSLLLGEFVALIYTIKKGNLIREPFRFSKNAKIISFTYFDLILTGLVGNIIAYFDRFMIYPLLGASSVSVYSVASFWGKAITPFIAPIANVMLSYLSQKDSKLSMRRFIIVFLFSVIPLILFGVIGIWIAPWITRILYPTLVGQAIPFIFIASMGGLIQSSTNLLMPLLLSTCSSRSIFFMQIIYFAFYILVSFIGVKASGLMGFCVAMCIVGGIKVIIIFGFGYHALNRKTLI